MTARDTREEVVAGVEAVGLRRSEDGRWRDTGGWIAVGPAAGKSFAWAIRLSGMGGNRPDECAALVAYLDARGDL